MTDAPRRPLPSADDPLFAPHLEALARGELLVQSCANHGLQWPPREMCLKCGSEPGWASVPREGVVYTFTVSHRPFHPWFADKLPFAVAVVELADGIRMLGAWAGPIDKLKCGAGAILSPHLEDGLFLLYWTPSEALA